MSKIASMFFGQPRLDRLSRLRGDARGVAAIEFAMIVPLMMAMFVGAVEFSQVITVDRRVSQVASATADLIARTKTLDASDMDGVMQVVQELVKPYSATPLKLTVLNVAADANNASDTKVCWSHNFQGGTGSYNRGSPYNLPAGIVEKGDSVIVTEVKYSYTPLIFNTYLPTGKELSEKYYLKPRLSSYVTFDNQTCP
jgi:Flp pilus assembly protein TadG